MVGAELCARVMWRARGRQLLLLALAAVLERVAPCDPRVCRCSLGEPAERGILTNMQTTHALAMLHRHSKPQHNISIPYTYRLDESTVNS